jgi:chromosome partitioning protein
MLGFMQSMLAEEILKSQMVKTTAISDAGLTKRTLYELDRSNFTRETYDRAIECMDAVNFEIQALIHKAWGRW